MNKVRIPGSTATTFGRIYADTTKADKRSTPVYVAEVRRLRAAIAAR